MADEYTNSRKPHYVSDADYTTNAPSYYDDLARKQGLIKELAERIWGYEETLNLSLQEIAQRFVEWDAKIEGFDGDVNELLQEWIADGTFDHIINESIFAWKANTTQLDGFVNVAEHGAIGDGVTDDYLSIQAAFNESKFVSFKTGKFYYSSQPILMQKDTTIEANNATLIFDNDGLNMGDYVWNQPKIYNLKINNKDSKKTGYGLFSRDGYIVYPKFVNVEINGFDIGLYSKAQTSNSNLSWGQFDKLRIEYNNIGILIEGGWLNTVNFGAVWLNYNYKKAMQIGLVTQAHNLVFDMLTLESNGLDADNQYATVDFVSVPIGQITVNNLYAENNSSGVVATAAEKTTYMTSGTKIDGFAYDSKSYRLNGKVYAEDSNRITPDTLTDTGLFRFSNSPNVHFRLLNTYFITNIQPIINFIDSGINVDINNLYLYTEGFSYPNARSVFINKTPLKSPKIKTKNLINVGGGSYNYGDLSIKIEGDLFTGFKTGGDLWISDNIKYKDVGRGYSKDAPLYVEFLHDLYNATNGDQKFIMTKDITLSASGDLKYYTGTDSTKLKNITVDEDATTKTLTINLLISPNQVRWVNVALNLHCNLTVNDKATTPETRAIYLFGLREIFIKGIFKFTSLVTAIDPPSLLVNGKITIKGGIDVVEKFYSQRSPMRGSNESYGTFTIPDLFVNTVVTYYVPRVPLLGLTIYQKTTKKLLSYDGVNWLDGTGTIVIPPS